MRPVNERRRYIVTTSLIGWAHTKTDPWASSVAVREDKTHWGRETERSFPVARFALSQTLCLMWCRGPEGIHTVPVIQWRIVVSHDVYSLPAHPPVWWNRPNAISHSTCRTHLCYLYKVSEGSQTGYNGDVTTWWCFLNKWWEPVDSPHKGPVIQGLMVSLLLVLTSCWTNIRCAGYLRHHAVSRDVTLIWMIIFKITNPRINSDTNLNRSVLLHKHSVSVLANTMR